MVPLNVLAPDDARGEDQRWSGVVARGRRSTPFSTPSWRARPRRFSLALVGFSQGSMMALHVGLRRRRGRRRSSPIRACLVVRTSSTKRKR